MCKIALINGTDYFVIPDNGLPLNYKGRLPLHFNVSGIYIIVENDSSNSYIGSSIHCGERLRVHSNLATRSHMIGTEHLLYSKVQQYGGHHFTVTPIHSSTNFLAQYLATLEDKIVTLSLKDYELLDAFTKYELAVIEQSYLYF